MSDDKSKVTDKASEIAKNIWLAGVGAYGRAVDEAQDRLEKAGVETPKLFKDLVKAGAKLEEEAREALSPTAARNSVEERINKVRENFHLQRPVRGEDLLVLHEKIDLLSQKIDILANALTEQGVLKVPAAKKKAPARKKTAAKKAARKAPARKKATTTGRGAGRNTTAGKR